MGGGGKGGGGGSSTINVNNSGTTTLDIVGLDDMRNEIEIKVPDPIEQITELKLPQPFKTESQGRTELAITEPIVTDSKNKIEVDMKPMVVDLCLDISMGKMPPTRIRQPVQQHFGFTLFGMEIFGFNFSGESQIIVDDYDPGPKVIGPADQHHGHHQAEARPAARKRKRKARTAVESAGGGLRIRLSDE